jgi:phospholipase/carboxylesterase
MKRVGARNARVGIVLAHGRGGSAADILRLMEGLGLPDVAAVAPEAPGNSWWPVSFLSPFDQTAAHVARGIAAMVSAVGVLEGEGIARQNIWLGGFSQGACLALETFAREGAGLAGVFGLSGGLVGTGDAEGGPDALLYGHGPKRLDYAGRREGGRVWLSVHAQDPHIPLKRAEDTAFVLRGMGAEVECKVYPGPGHAVMPADVARMRGWLNA